MGAAFQIQDDLLNIAPDPRYGKELNGDLMEGKRSLLLIDAYRRASSAERARMTASCVGSTCSEALSMSRTDSSVSEEQ